MHKALADVDAALKNYKVEEDTTGATGKKGATAKEKLLAQRAGVGKERKGKAQAEAKGKAKADAKKGNKREPSELEKSLKGDKRCINQIVAARLAIDATPARWRAPGVHPTHWSIYAQAIK